MKKIFLFPLLLSAFLSCKREADTSDPEFQKLAEENQRLLEETHRKDSAVNSVLEAFGEIQTNLDIIREKEKILSVSAKDPELSQSQKDRIISDIQAINELMDKNRNTIQSMRGQLKKANLRISEIEKMIERLSKTIEERDTEISALKDDLARANTALKTLFEEYNARVEELHAQTEKANAAFYAFGTFRELKDQGIITKEGGFIGIGRAEKLKDNFNKSYFTGIDITQTKFILLDCKKARLVTSHPTGSYALEGNGRVERLVISNPDEFWAASRYLVVVTE